MDARPPMKISSEEDMLRKCISCNVGCAGNRIGVNRPIRCTVNPARDMGLTGGEGTLTVGKTADAAVFRRHEREVRFGDRPNGDPDQRTWKGRAVYEPVVTVKRGMVVYRNIRW